MPALPDLLRGHRTAATAAASCVALALVVGAVLLTSGPAMHAAGSATADSTVSPASASGTATSLANLSASAKASTSATPSGTRAPSGSASASGSTSAASISSTAAPAGPPALALGAHQTVPGSLHLAWPSQGQAQIGIYGQGTLGGYGPVTTAQPIASVTKTMTAYLILRNHPLSPGQQGPAITITAADVATYQYDVGQNMSTVPVTAGEQITENQALQALMLASADNIADVLAHWDTGTSTDAAFIAKMNTEAADLGMAHTHYADASGYDPGSVSTAPDQITLAQHAMTIGYFADLVDQSSAVIPDAGTIDNYNSLLGFDGVDGIKTGSTGQAGGCLLFNANITVNGRPLALIGAVLGQDAPTGQELGVGLAAAKSLIASTESEITSYTLVAANTAAATLPLVGGGTKTLHTTRNLTVTGWPGEPVTLTLTGAGTTTTLKATTPSGQYLGSVPLS